MKYIDVAWKASGQSDPYRLVSELDEQGSETRKLEFFHSGCVGSASALHATASTELGEKPVPPLVDINADPQFLGVELSAAEFECLWAQHGRALKEYEVVKVLASTGGLPVELIGARAVVLLVHEARFSPAYELECLATDGSTVWQGALPREVLRAVRADDA